MEKETLRLAEAVGYFLTGKSVQVREKVPGTKGNAGEIHRNPAGQLIVDVSPTIKTDKRRLHVLLHEFAHAKHHTYKASNHASAAPASVKKEPLDNWEQRREVTAEKQTAIWEAYADKHANPDLVKMAPFTAKLISLLGYKEKE